MTDATFTPDDVAPFDRGRLSQRHSSWTVAGAGAVTLGVLLGSWMADHRAATLAPRPLEPGAARLTAAFHTPPAPLPTLPSASAAPRDTIAAPRDTIAAPRDTIAAPRDTIAAPRDTVAAPREVDVALLDPGLVHGPAPAPLAESAPLEPRFVAPRPAVAAEAPAPAADGPPLFAMMVPLQDAPDGPHDVAPAPVPSPAAAATPQIEAPRAEPVPLPASRPAFRWAAPEQLRSSRRQMAKNTDTAPTPAATPAPAADNRGFLERFFGALKPSNGPTLAYASPEDGLFGRAAVPAGPASTPHDRHTAVYDISAHTVYMPNGAKLEAHSGLGRMLDDPRHVDARNVGPTPPHVYDLTLRESLFHGVQALRLNPVGGGGVFGRTGLLAHTFMLGPNGDSNGCVSFRDYQAFLRAYQNGEVRRLVVVPGIG